MEVTPVVLLRNFLFKGSELEMGTNAVAQTGFLRDTFELALVSQLGGFVERVSLQASGVSQRTLDNDQCASLNSCKGNLPQGPMMWKRLAIVVREKPRRRRTGGCN